MSINQSFLGKRLRVIVSSNSYIYRGKCIEDTPTHLTLEDSKTHNVIYLIKDKLSVIEIMEVGTYE